MDPPQDKHTGTSTSGVSGNVLLKSLRPALDVLVWLNVYEGFMPMKPNSRDGAWRYGASQKVEEMTRLFAVMTTYKLDPKTLDALSNEETACLLDTALSALGILFVEERFKPMTPTFEAAALRYGIEEHVFSDLFSLVLAHSGEKFDREIKAGFRRDRKPPDWFQ